MSFDRDPVDDRQTTEAFARRERNCEMRMFGCATELLDRAIASKRPRDRLMFAMSILSDAQEVLAMGPQLRRDPDDEARQLMNRAKYVLSSMMEGI